VSDPSQNPAQLRSYLRDIEREQQSTFLELFFDLVFVFAVTQLSHHLLADLTWHGLGQTALMLVVVWWAWIYTTWMGNRFDPERVEVRLVLVVLALGSLLMAAAIPHAFDEDALLFAGAYVAVQGVRNVAVVLAVRHEHPALGANFTRILAWGLAAAPLWIAGALQDGTARVVLWVLAVAVDYAGPALRYWTPGMGASTLDDWAIEHGHFSERFQLFVIIALGESVVVTGATASEAGLGGDVVLALVLAFAVSAALWWLYFDQVAGHARRRLEADDASELARDAYTYLHIPIIAGIIVSAVGDEVVIAHPHEHLALAEALAVVGGPILYLLGHLLFRRRMTGTHSRTRPPAIVALALLLPLSEVVSATLLAGAVAAILVALCVVETRQGLR
jgi:low temperature requirement protein LtrA